MKITTSRTRRLWVLLAMSMPLAVMAQDRDRDRAQDRTQDQTAIRDQAADRAADQDRIADRDRAQDRDRTADQDRDRDQTRDQDRTQDRTQDRSQDRDATHEPLYVRDREQLRNRDIYGAQLMTRKELSAYRSKLATKNTVREWAQFRAQHQTQMMARARERGVQLPAPVYGQQLMTHQEREQLQTRLQNAATEQERERIRAEHRNQMQERAREYQIPLTDLGKG